MSNALADLLDKGVLTEDDKFLLIKKVLLLYHLSTLQQNICTDIERMLRGKDEYRFIIKHNHEAIKRYVRNCYNDFMKDFSRRQTDYFCENADDLERVVNKWAGINDKIL